MPDDKEKFPAHDYTKIQTKEEIRSRREAPGQNKKKPKPKVKPKVKKQTIGEKIAENFLAADGEDIKDHLIFDWLIPELKAALEDVLHMLLYGGRGGRGGRRGRDRSERGYTSYDRAFDDDDRRRDPTKANFKHLEFHFYNIKDAQRVLDDMREALETSSGGYVTVKELYNHDYIQRPTTYSMGNWGWYDLEDADIAIQRGEYILKMPPAEPFRNR